MPRLKRSDLPIVTPRLVLRDFEPPDLAPLERVAADRRIAEHSPAQTRALSVLTQVAAGSRPRRFRNRRSFDFAVVLRRRGIVIGACDLSLTGRGTADFGYVLAPRHWGFGYGTEVARALVQFAFETLRLRQLAAVVAVENDRSRRVLDKAGLHWDGLLRRHARFAGRWWDCHRYVIDRDGWQAGRVACAPRPRVGS